MIEVELPDGTIAEFPDGTSQDVMRSALRKRFAGKTQEVPAAPVSEPMSDLPEPNTGLGRAMRAVRNPINAVNRAFSNIYTLGSLDEIEGAADAAMTDQSFSDARAASRQRSDEQRAEYPVMTTAAGLAGAVASPAAQLAMRYFPVGASPITQIGAGGATGAVMGGVQGFMEGEGGAMGRVGNALQGIGIGTALGAAFPAAAMGVGAAYRGARNALNDYRGIGQASKSLGISHRAGRLLSDTLEMDDVTNMRSALQNPNSMLADAGPSTQGALDVVMQSPGEGARTALRRIDDRATAAGGRLNDALDQSLTGNNVGAPGGRQFSDTARLQGDVRQATAPARKAVYDTAYSKPIDYASQQGRALLDDISPRLPQEAIGYANKLMRMKGEKSAQIMANIADDGTVTFTNPPDVRQWDYIKRALDGLAETSEGTGALGAQTTMGGAFKSLARDIRTNLGQAVPEYDYAVNTAGDIIGEIKAIKTGETLLSARVNRAEAESVLDGMSKAEAAAVKRGLRASIDDAVANVKAVASDPNADAREAYKSYQMLTSRSSQDKMKLLLGEDWGPLKGALDDAAQALGLRARTSTNSRTFGRQQFGQMLDDSLAPGVVRKGEPINMAKAAWQRVMGSTPAQIQKAKGSVRNELADILTRPNALGTLNALEGARAAFPILPTAGRGVTNALNALGLSSLPASVPEVRNRLLR